MQKWPLHPHQTCKNLAETGGEAAGAGEAAGEAGSRGHGGGRGDQEVGRAKLGGVEVGQRFGRLFPVC